MSSNYHSVRPARNQTWNVFANYRLSKNGSVQNIPNCSIRTLIHLFQIIFLHPSFVRRYCGALNAHIIFKDSVRSVDGHLIFGLIAIRKTEIVVQTIDLQLDRLNINLNSIGFT